MPIRFQLVLAAALPIMVACASGTGQGPRTSSSTITRAELVELDVRNAYEAIDRLRPLWLRVRGGARSFQRTTEVAVFQDDMYLGSLDVLERVGTEGIFSMRFVDGPTAQATLSGGGIQDRHIRGAIIIYMRPSGRDAAAQGN